MLEDLALRDNPTSSSLKHVITMKGESEVNKRKMFLEIIKAE